MSLVVLGSAKGAPGVTTAALALAATWPAGREAVVVEADPDGGVLAARAGLDADPGLVSLAAAARRGAESVDLAAHAQQVESGPRVVAGPPAPEQVAAALAALAPVGGHWRTAALDVLLDAGRLAPAGPTRPFLDAADLVVLVCRPRVEEVRLLLHRLSWLEALSAPVGLLVVGARPYVPEEVAGTLGLPLLGLLAHDRRSADSGPVPLFRRAPLLRSARSAAEVISARLSGGRAA